MCGDCRTPPSRLRSRAGKCPFAVDQSKRRRRRSSSSRVACRVLGARLRPSSDHNRFALDRSTKRATSKFVLGDDGVVASTPLPRSSPSWASFTTAHSHPDRPWGSIDSGAGCLPNEIEQNTTEQQAASSRHHASNHCSTTTQHHHHAGNQPCIPTPTTGGTRPTTHTLARRRRPPRRCVRWGRILRPPTPPTPHVCMFQQPNPQCIF